MCALQACSHTQILSGEQIAATDLAQIKSLSVLQPEEKIILISTTAGIQKSGSFFTGNKVVHYSFGKTKAENAFDTASFSNILAIDTNYHPPGDFMVPRLRITRNDHHLFMLYADGSKGEVSAFFTAIISQWYRAIKHRKVVGNNANYN